MHLPRQRRPFRITSGFSLVETLIVIAISVLMMVAVADMLLTYGKTFDIQSATIEVNTSASRILNAVELLSLQSDGVASSYTVSGVTYTSSSSTLVLAIPSIDSSGNIVSGAHDYAIFYATSSTAYEIFQANAGSMRRSGTTTLSTTIRSLTFTYDTVDVTSATQISVDVQTGTSVKQQDIAAHLTSQTHLRN